MTLRETTSPARGNGRGPVTKPAALNTRAGRCRDRPGASEPAPPRPGGTPRSGSPPRRARVHRRLAPGRGRRRWRSRTVAARRSGRPVPAVALLGMFVATQAFVVNVQLRREARSVFLSEVAALPGPHVAGAPARRSAARPAPWSGSGLLRRSTAGPEKLAFNLALRAAEAAVAVAVFDALSRAGDTAGAPLRLLAATPRRPRPAPSPRSAWVSSSSCSKAPCGSAPWSGRPPRPPCRPCRWRRSAPRRGPPGRTTRGSAVPLAVVTAVILLGYRAYAQLRERHLALERLHRFSQVHLAGTGRGRRAARRPQSRPARSCTPSGPEFTSGVSPGRTGTGSTGTTASRSSSTGRTSCAGAGRTT